MAAPPAPFKLFVLLAGVAGVRPLKFVLGVGIARGLRYLVIGILAIRYGDFALQLLEAHGRTVALALVGIILVGAVAWWLWTRTRRAAGQGNMVDGQQG